MQNKLIEQIKEHFGACSLDLAGEIIIQNSNRTQLLSLNQNEHDLINNRIKVISQRLPMLQVTKKDSLVECRIVLFAYKRPTAKRDFLDTLQKELSELTKVLLDNGGLHISMNIFGCFTDGVEKQQYRYLNKSEQVEYVITERTALGVLDKVCSHQVKAYLAAAFCLFLLLDMCYEALIAGHGWRLTDFWELFKNKSNSAGVNAKDIV